jgi:hypothetical protein
MNSDVGQAILKVSRRYRANAIDVEDTECVKRIEVWTLNDFLLRSFKSALQADQLIDQLEDTLLCVVVSRRRETVFCAHSRASLSSRVHCGSIIEASR